MLRILAALAVLALAGAPLSAVDGVDLAVLPTIHPRLILTPPRVAELRGLITTDAHAKFLWERIRTSADDLLTKPPLQRKLEGYRLLSVSRECLRRLTLWSLTQALTGEDRYRDRAVTEIRAVCAFTDWNPQHFLDVGEMTAALALAHDWLYDALGTEDRARIEDAIIAKGLVASETGKQWWIEGHNNWNQVCHAGMVLGALAVAERDPALAQRILRRAQVHLHHGLDAYAPDGVYPEGAGYWGYGTDFTVLTLACLETALGTDWAVLASPGLVGSFDFRRHAMDPADIPVLFADAGWGKTAADPMWSYYPLARMAGRPDLQTFVTAYHEQHLAKVTSVGDRLFPLALACYRPAPPAVDAPARDWFGHGPIQFASMRSAWNDPLALWATLKGGKNAWNHSHLDTGVFELAADGVRWAWDLGADKHLYSRKDTWGLQQDSARWTYLRTHNQGHNVVSVGERAQRVDGEAPLIATGSTNRHAFAILDTATAFADMARTVRRGVALVERRVAVIQDEFVEPVAEPLTWRWYTRAAITLKGGEALLAQGGKNLHLRILAPAGAVFAEGSVKPFHDYENPNEGFRVLTITIAPPHAKDLTICVVATPGSAAGKVHLGQPVPLGDWATTYGK